MNRIEQKVSAARRRLILGRFGKAICGTLFLGLVVATAAVALPGLLAIDVDFRSWVYGWVGGAIGVAVMVAAVVAWATAPSRVEVAAEVDRRFGLGERLSSSLALSDRERDSDFATALLADAERRAEQLQVADQFALRPSKLGWLPLAVMPLLVVALLVVDPVGRTSAGIAPAVDPAETQQVKVVAQQLRQQLEQQRQKAASADLKEATELYEQLTAKLDRVMSRKPLDRKEALIAINDLKQQLEQRRNQLGSSQEMRKALAQLNGVPGGPAEKIAKSVAQGDFNQARDLVKELAKQLRDDTLSDAEREQLQQQINQLREALENAAQQHASQQQALQQMIDQARQAGRGDEAARLQQKLNQLQQQQAAMQDLADMAQAMAQSAEALEQGDSAAAAEALEQLGDQLGQMASQMSELENLQATLNDVVQSKAQMRCSQCQGGGCQSCQPGARPADQAGAGIGSGAGQSSPPEAEGPSNTYETQVRGQFRRGQAIVAGVADGPNRKGVSREELKEAVATALTEAADPTENQTLPRTEREHTQSYFQQLRQQ